MLSAELKAFYMVARLSPFNTEQVDTWMLELAEQTLGCKVQVVERLAVATLLG